ncbi:MAG TPA: PIN domain-containing protein [Pirellulales bacterium]|nr:PIN domain-containing protein [Pirellulales bacterium]
MNEVFLDTVGMIAVWDDTDQWHSAAKAAYALLLSQERRLVTTELVLCECGNASARRSYRQDVCDLPTALIEEAMLIEPSGEDVELAWAAYERAEAAQAGIVDHVSFVVMRRLGIAEAFTNDSHFEAAGFSVLF